MHTLWMTGICTSFPATAFDDEGRIALDKMLSDYGVLESGAQMSLDETALRRIADETLLKYPW